MKGTDVFQKTNESLNKLEWIDWLKAFAILGILLNHYVEAFLDPAWFTNPFENFPDFSKGLQQFFPQHKNILVAIFQFLGWLGDSGPGIFIFLSGFTLMLSVVKNGMSNFSSLGFFKKRLLRIYPLYIAVHLVILGVFIFIQDTKFEVSSIKTLLSFLGLRFTNELFFYINPSWWFIWLIIQLYLVFPVLIWLFKKAGLQRFLIITFSLTFLARLMGLLGYDVNHNLYYWMTGIFGGTRLAEFTAGMGLAFLYYKSNGAVLQLFAEKKGALLLISTYIFGLACSLWYPATIISNLLVTIGLSGIFFVVWNITKRYTQPKNASKIFLWMGLNSYAIFLVHQPFLTWSTKWMPGNMAMAGMFLVLSIPVSWAINKFVEFIIVRIKTGTGWKTAQILALVLAIISITYLFYFEPDMQNQGIHRILAFFVLLTNLLILLITYFLRRNEWPLLKILLYFGASVSLIILFIAPKHYGFLVLFFLITFIPLLLILKRFVSLEMAPLVSIIIIALGWLIMEAYLYKKSPLETWKWGEFPALQTHATRVYSLKPSLETNLKYNNYNYVLRTNSYGLAGPEITIAEKDTSFRILIIGDAFTMPEGIEYPMSYPNLLEKKLKLQYPFRNIQVINGGVTGYGPVESFAEMQELGQLFKPNIIIYQFFINEFEEVNYLPEERLKNIGLIEPENLNFISKMVYSSQVLLHLNAAYNSMSQSIKSGTNQYCYWKSLLHFYDRENTAIYNQETLLKITDYLEKMKNTAESLNASFLVCYVPGAVSVSKREDMDYFPKNVSLENNTSLDLLLPYTKLHRICDSLKIAMIDLTPKLKSFKKQPVYFRNSWHWNQYGHLAASDTLADFLVAEKWIRVQKVAK